MTLRIELNEKQEEALRKMFDTGLYGVRIEETAARILDQAFIDYSSLRPDFDDEREPWQRGDN